jgi:predicted MFS family arabinose efflux permease
MRRFDLFLLTSAHFFVDSYATLLTPLLPLINERLGLNLAYAGLLGTIVSLCNLMQPLLGMWADRMARRYLVVAGLFDEANAGGTTVIFATHDRTILSARPRRTVAIVDGSMLEIDTRSVAPREMPVALVA